MIQAKNIMKKFKKGVVVRVLENNPSGSKAKKDWVGVITDLYNEDADDFHFRVNFNTESWYLNPKKVEIANKQYFHEKFQEQSKS